MQRGMTEYVIFTLAAPLASWGTIAVGERRPTWERPSKSAIVGLIAGALGIPRSADVQLATLTSGLGFAVRIDHPGVLEVDYHTTQTPTQVSRKRRLRSFGAIRTRADELRCDELKTILSEREFYTGSFSTVALWKQPGEAPSLSDIENALRRPSFVPYAGRKAHPFMLPVSPSLLAAESITKAFAEYDLRQHGHISTLKDMLGIQAQGHRPIYADADAVLTPLRLEERRDLPQSRSKWHFGLRLEALLHIDPTDNTS
jgi:CRISPR system Cascade subunit CasD